MTTSTAPPAVRVGYIPQDATDVTIEVITPLTKAELRQQLRDELLAAGHTDKQIRRLFGLFDELRGLVRRRVSSYRLTKYPNREIYAVLMTMRQHDLLEAIMEDLQLPAPGSWHQRVNEIFMPDGWTVIHDRDGFCVIEAMRYGDAIELEIAAATS